MKIGYFLSTEEYTPEQLIEQARLAEEAGLRRAVDQRPLPSLERRAGRVTLRVVGHRRDLAGVRPSGDHRGDLPDGADPPGGDRPGRRHQRGAARGSVRPRGRLWRGPQRAHPGRPLADGRRPAGDARGGRRGDPQAVDGRVREPSRPALHRRQRADLHPPRHSAAHLRLGVRSGGDRGRGQDRGRFHHHLARRGPVSKAVPSPARPTPRRDSRCAWAETEDEGAKIAHRLWANSGLPGELAQVLPSPKHFEQASSPGHGGIHP